MIFKLWLTLLIVAVISGTAGCQQFEQGGPKFEQGGPKIEAAEGAYYSESTLNTANALGKVAKVAGDLVEETKNEAERLLCFVGILTYDPLACGPLVESAGNSALDAFSDLEAPPTLGEQWEDFVKKVYIKSNLQYYD
jgi:inosine-uridine nucleoside N-ribohydrolase